MTPECTIVEAIPAGMVLRGRVYHADFMRNGRRVRRRLSTDLEAAKLLLNSLQAREDLDGFQHEVSLTADVISGRKTTRSASGSRSGRLLDVAESPEDANYEIHLTSRYGMDAEDYNRLLIKQGKVCAICGTDTSNAKNDRFVVDHDHFTGNVRGLLCLACNSAIGTLGDNVPGVLRALHYLLHADGCRTLSDWAERTERLVRVHIVRYANRANLMMRYVDPATGKQVTKTARTTDKRQARERAAEWENEVNAQRNRTVA